MDRYRWSAIVSIVIAFAVVGSLSAAEWAFAQTGTEGPTPTPTPTPYTVEALATAVAANQTANRIKLNVILARLDAIKHAQAADSDSIAALDLLFSDWPTGDDWGPVINGWPAAHEVTERNLENAEFMVDWIAANQPRIDQFSADLAALLSATQPSGTPVSP
jgi:hypothetical protein